MFCSNNGHCCWRHPNGRVLGAVVVAALGPQPKRLHLHARIQLKLFNGLAGHDDDGHHHHHHEQIVGAVLFAPPSIRLAIKATD